MSVRMRAAVYSGVAALTVTFAISASEAPANAEQQQSAPAQQSAASPDLVKRGEYIVTTSGCHDCHTPHKMGPNGPEPDMTRALSGHPATMQLPPPPKAEGPWIIAGAATFTAWAGPWGTSHTANLTPDKETGLGLWTEQQFIDTLRSGRRQGRGRPILPPMPWPVYGKMTDEDLKAMFAYLRTLPSISNKVPEPVLAEAPPK